MPSFGERLVSTFLEKGHLCVGIDPSPAQLSKWGLGTSANSAREFSFELIDASSGSVGIIKPQIAFFEQFGALGFQVLEEVLHRAKSANLLVIADAKRGDIGSTMDGYASAWLSDQGVFQCDALTLSPYLGPESLSGTTEIALKNNRGVFILAATSNPESTTIQQASSGDQTVASKVVEFAGSQVTGLLGSVGVVIGATVEVGDFAIEEQSLSRIPILVPGFGAQGASLTSARKLFPTLGENLVCSASRSIAGDSKEGLIQRIEKAASELEVGLSA